MFYFVVSGSLFVLLTLSHIADSSPKIALDFLFLYGNPFSLVCFHFTYRFSLQIICSTHIFYYFDISLVVFAVILWLSTFDMGQRIPMHKYAYKCVHVYVCQKCQNLLWNLDWKSFVFMSIFAGIQSYINIYTSVNFFGYMYICVSG